MSGARKTAYVGESVLRREDSYLMRGKGQFLDDISEPRDTLYMGFVTSPVAHAEILSVDTAAAAALPGVFAVLDGKEVAKLARPIEPDTEIAGYVPVSRRTVALDRARFVGEYVAVILAEDPYVLQDAAELVELDYRTLPVAASLEAACASDAPLVHDTVPGNKVFQGTFATSDFEREFASRPHTLRETFTTGWVAGIPLEPRGCLAVPDLGGAAFTLYTSTQIPHVVRSGVAEQVGIAENCLRVVVPEVGGGFGTKANIYPEEILSIVFAKTFGRAIKWVQDRREDILNSIHARNHVYDLEAAFDDEGVIHAARLFLLTNAGAYPSFPFGCTLEATGGARMVVGPYRIRHYAYDARAILTHTTPAGAYRGVAQPSCFMAIEGMMDRIGRRLGIDPAEIRRRNLVRPHELPWVSAVGVRYDTGSYSECLAKALELSRYDSFRATQALGLAPDGKYRGIGICCFTESTGTGAPGWRARGLSRVSGLDSANIRVEPNGQIVAFISQAASGQGHATAFAQLVADQMGARLEDVVVREGDTATTPFGTGTIASRSAITGGGAIILAGTALAAKMRRIAASQLEVSEGDVVLRGGRAEVEGTDLSCSFEAIARTAYSLGKVKLPAGEDHGLEETKFYDPPMVTIANAVHVAKVAVDPIDARVEIEDYVVVHDCGRLINPMIVNGQIHGGTAQGIGEALMEEIVYDDEGQLLNANLLDYLLPTSLDIPNMTIEHIETPSIDALGGFKGVGEGGTIGAVPVLVNAVADALAGLGCNINRVPMRPAYLAGELEACRR